MAEDRVTVVHVMPSGVATLPLPDGNAVTCRVTVGHLDCPDTGLIDELGRGREPTPWRSLAIRDEALAIIDGRSDLDQATQARLLQHVRNSPYYEGL
ncbi:MAG: hypothetical protein IM654_10055 [Phenylobacterium sp.]|nr:hypothetical protein [Phenylobacterium sp.]